MIVSDPTYFEKFASNFRGLMIALFVPNRHSKRFTEFPILNLPKIYFYNVYKLLA